MPRTRERDRLEFLSHRSIATRRRFTFCESFFSNDDTFSSFARKDEFGVR